MTEREEKPSAAPLSAAEDEILLDSPLVESEEGPGVDAPGVAGPEAESATGPAPGEPAASGEARPAPARGGAGAGSPAAAGAADADVPDGASSPWPREAEEGGEATLPATAGGGEPPVPVEPGEAEEMEPEEEKPMTLLEHLGELRRRLVRGFLAILIGFFACYGFAKELFYYLSLPLLKVMPADAKFIYTGVAEGFFVDLKVSFVAGLFVACPYLLYQIWAIIAPGL